MKKYFLLLLVMLAACTASPKPVACTLDAKICPDGSAVGRVGPDCEFAPCPIVTECDYDDPEKSYAARSAEKCKSVMFKCAEGQEAFFDSCGCGCTSSKVPEDYCRPDERGQQACTKEYRPVCGWFNEEINCLRYPCATTYSNRCGACADENVAYVTDGECPA